MIIQDDREPEMNQLMFLVDSNLKMERKRLKIGDYSFGNVIVERKEMNDFCLSIIDGRLMKQVEGLNEEQKNGKKCFIILIGRISERDSQLHENCILGKLCSLVYKHNISVLMVDNDFQFCYCLKNLYEKSCGLKNEMKRGESEKEKN